MFFWSLFHKILLVSKHKILLLTTVSMRLYCSFLKVANNEPCVAHAVGLCTIQIHPLFDLNLREAARLPSLTPPNKATQLDVISEYCHLSHSVVVPRYSSNFVSPRAPRPPRLTRGLAIAWGSSVPSSPAAILSRCSWIGPRYKNGKLGSRHDIDFIWA